MLNHFFKLKPMELDEDDGDDTRQLDSSEFKDPSKTISWTAVWATHTAHLTFSSSYTGDVSDPMVIYIKTKVTEFDHEGTNMLKIICSSPRPEPYIFIIVVNIVQMTFDPMYMLDSLEALKYDEIKSTLRTKILEGK